MQTTVGQVQQTMPDHAKEIRKIGTGFNYGQSEVLGACATFGPMVGHYSCIGASLQTLRFHKL